MKSFYATKELRSLIEQAGHYHEKLRLSQVDANAIEGTPLELAKNVERLTQKIERFKINNAGDVCIKLTFYIDLLKYEGPMVAKTDSISDMIKQLFEDFNHL